MGRFDLYNRRELLDRRFGPPDGAARQKILSAWRAASRAQDMLEFAEDIGIDGRVFVRLACDFARRSLQFGPTTKRSREALALAEEWAAGKRVAPKRLRKTAAMSKVALEIADACNSALRAALADAEDDKEGMAIFARCAAEAAENASGGDASDPVAEDPEQADVVRRRIPESAIRKALGGRRERR